jgi:hypothetical protein
MMSLLVERIPPPLLFAGGKFGEFLGREVMTTGML